MLRPTAVAVAPMPVYWLRVEFDNGESGLFDVKPYLKGSWFGELLDEALFKSVFVNGMTVEWEGDQDICPDEPYSGTLKDA